MENQSDRRLQQRERLPHVAEERLVHRLKGERPAFPTLREEPLVRGGDANGFRSRLLQRHARLQPPEDAQPVRAASRRGGLECKRHPGVR
jgi:hypothetical protein